MEYDKLLKRALEKIPKKQEGTGERFDIPRVKGHLEGNKTIIVNFKEICDTLGRDQSLILKYLQRELATPANVDGARLILGRKLSSELINQKIERFALDFVICKVCKKPDTHLMKEHGVDIMKCTACGAKSPVRSKL